MDFGFSAGSRPGVCPIEHDMGRRFRDWSSISSVCYAGGAPHPGFLNHRVWVHRYRGVYTEGGREHPIQVSAISPPSRTAPNRWGELEARSSRRGALLSCMHPPPSQIRFNFGPQDRLEGQAVDAGGDFVISGSFTPQPPCHEHTALALSSVPCVDVAGAGRELYAHRSSVRVCSSGRHCTWACLHGDAALRGHVNIGALGAGARSFRAVRRWR
jgi:hypothetical protein